MTRRRFALLDAGVFGVAFILGITCLTSQVLSAQQTAKRTLSSRNLQGAWRKGARVRRGMRVALKEDTATFTSGGITLFGKLTRTANGPPKSPVVVFVHGSDETASVDRMWDPYLFAANGVAMFVFDKRGTGRSGGQYMQMFSVLSDDVVAATHWLRQRSDIDSARIGVVGFSQGGWVAPLAALKDPGIRFMLVGYGMTMSVAEEDRMEAPLKLRERGFSGTDIREFEELNAAIHRAAERSFADGGARSRRSSPNIVTDHG